MDERATHELIGEIYAAVTEPDRWPAVLETISAAHGGASILLGRQNFVSGMQSLMTCRMPPESVDRYARDFSRPERLDFLRKVPEIALAQPITPEMHQGEEAFLSSPLYYRVFRPFGLRYLVSTTLYREADWACFLALVRPPEAGPYAPLELERIGWLSQHLARAMALQNALQVSDGTVRMLSDLVDRFDRAAIVCNADGGIRFANGSALAILRRADGLLNWSNRIGAVIPHDEAQLRQLISEAASTSAREGVEPGGALRIARRDDGGDYPVIVSPMPTVSGGEGADRLALLMISDPANHVVPAPGRLAELHDLTPTEARLAARLLLGETPTEAAAELGISIATVRFHLRNLFAKTGTRHQVELVARLNTTL
jgi:DNA-binding CsgD family transcriptional regulator/PAS domain-containing protein